MKEKKKIFKGIMMAIVLVSFLTFPVIGLAEENAPKEETKKEEKKEPPFKMSEMVVTATRSETPQKETTKSVSVVTADDMEDHQEYFMPELINNEPGVYFRQPGGLGQWSTITIRGASERHTLFQYNGMPLRDAADPQNSFAYFTEDLFGTSGLDRVEILKGTNSTLYGSQAMGGVINIIPRKWQKGFTGEFRNEVGPNGTYIGNARLAYGADKYYIDINPMYVTTDGEKFGGDHRYYYDNAGLTLGAGVKPSDLTSLEFSVLAYDTELAMGDSPQVDAATGKLNKQKADPDQYREGRLYQLGLTWNHKVASLWDYTLKGSYGETERHYFHLNTKDSRDKSYYDGETTYLEMQHNLHPADWLTFNIGADYDKAVYKEQDPSDPYSGDYTPVRWDEEWTTYDIFAQAQLKLLDRSLFFTLGGRYNDPEKFDDKTVWEASGAYILKATQTKFHAHVGTGYRTPSLYETYGKYVWSGSLVGIGNEDLKPEESTGYEVGIDQSFANDKVKVGATYFHTRFKNWIAFDMLNYRYDNADKTKLSGVEAYINVRPYAWLKLNLAYTYTDTRAEDENGDWARGSYQPYNKFNVVATVYPTDKLTFLCDVSYLDNKTIPLYDTSWNQVQWEDKSRWIVNMAASYKLLKFMDLFVKVKNLFDEEYTESGYYMPERAVYGGVKLYF